MGHDSEPAPLLGQAGSPEYGGILVQSSEAKAPGPACYRLMTTFVVSR